MKKTCTLLLILALCLALAVPSFAANITLSQQNLSVDGKTVSCEKYNIDGYNYFKLRDLAYFLNGTPCQFSVGYNEETKTVSVVTGEAYVSDGSVPAAGTNKASTAVPSTQSILVNGAAVSDLSVYNIGGNNFFKLRDLAEYLGFAVDYDADTNTALIGSSGARTLRLLLHETVVSGGKTAVTDNTYDAKGNPLTQKHTDSANPAANYSASYTYNTAGQCTQKVYVCAAYTATSVYTYDQNGNVINGKTTTVYTDRTIVFDTAYSYAAENGETVESSVCTYQDGETEKTIASSKTYGVGRRLLKQSAGRATASGSDLTVYTYDSTGRLAKEELSSTIDRTASTTVYTYNKDGALVSRVSSGSFAASAMRSVSATDYGVISTSYLLDASGRPVYSLYAENNGSGKSYTVNGSYRYFDETDLKFELTEVDSLGKTTVTTAEYMEVATR